MRGLKVPLVTVVSFLFQLMYDTTGVRVNCLCPSFAETALLERLPGNILFAETALQERLPGNILYSGSWFDFLFVLHFVFYPPRIWTAITDGRTDGHKGGPLTECLLSWAYASEQKVLFGKCCVDRLLHTPDTDQDMEEEDPAHETSSPHCNRMNFQLLMNFVQAGTHYLTYFK